MNTFKIKTLEPGTKRTWSIRKRDGNFEKVEVLKTDEGDWVRTDTKEIVRSGVVANRRRKEEAEAQKVQHTAANAAQRVAEALIASLR